MNHKRMRTVPNLVALLAVLVLGLSSVMAPAQAAALQATVVSFAGAELLGRPTASSITINIVPNTTIEYHYQYGTAPGSYTWQTTNATATGGQPDEVVIGGLAANTKYYYRMRYHLPGETDWVERSEHSFWTQRAPGSTFTFTVTADSHVNIMLGSASTWTQTMTNVANDHPDLHLDLGDTFAMDSVTTVAGAESAYLYQRQFFDLVGDSASIFIAPGNHEQQEAWHLDDTANPALAPPVLSTNAQKKYYPNPVPDGFYSGDTETYSYLDGDQLKEDYYAWTWGDALFVVIDPFWYTTTKPYTGNTGGGESSDVGSGDRWDWTLGLQQFNWLKETLENSTAEYKFVFAHHMVGGSDDYVRGGANPAHICEWGGYNEAGTTYEWTTRRPGWGSEPVHQILVDNGVSAFFHGHDHQYAYEKRDGVVYQALPAAGFSGSGFGVYSTGSGYTIQALNSPGHLRVTVSPSQATVDYVGTSSGTVNYSYTIEPSGGTIYHDLSMAADPLGGGTTNPTVGVHAYAEGSIVDITATPAAGYAFDHWSGACTGSGACQVTMGADKSVTAHFEASGPGGSATSSAVPSDGTPSIGEQVVVAISIDVTDVDPPDEALGGFTGTLDWDPTVLGYHSNSGILAGFTGLVNVSQASSGHIVFNGANASGATGDITVLSVTFDAIGVGDSDLDLGYSAMAAAYTFNSLLPLLTVYDGHVEVSPAEYTLTMAVDPVAGGTTDPPVGDHTYAGGTVVDITASPAAGYEFDHWSGDCTGSGACQVTMDGDKSITAHFTVGVTSYELTMAVDPVGGGTTDPAVGVHTYAGGTVVDITASPAVGYDFDHWSGDCTGTGACQVTMDADKSVTAHFADLTPPDTSITAHPEDPSRSTDASFSFTSTEPGSTFECQLDSGGFGACTSPETYTDLNYGEHTFEVYAVDGAGNPDPTPASYNWTIYWVGFLPLVMGE
jgi:hypothetical protein